MAMTVLPSWVKVRVLSGIVEVKVLPCWVKVIVLPCWVETKLALSDIVGVVDEPTPGVVQSELRGVEPVGTIVEEVTLSCIEV